MKTQLTKLIGAALVGGALLVSSGCATKVSRLDEGVEVALSDRWNAKDSELVANEMINDMLSFPWARDFEMENNQRPAEFIKHLAINHKEKIPMNTFINNINAAVFRLGVADLVVVAVEVEALLEEVVRQKLIVKKRR